MTNTIEMIPIRELHPHKDNPRKQIGDLTELTESIRKNGIMQNLTVVKGYKVGEQRKEDGYTIIIGHRRCAAARAAGLTEVPCIVADMDERQQLCTMMEENMQREDLTVAEQAYGFQYMFDLGVGLDEIAKRTGFAESTVKHRLEIAKLDKDKLHKAMESDWQITIKDLMMLEKIKDVETRNKILNNTGYSRQEFKRQVAAAERNELMEKNKEKWMPLLEELNAKTAPKNVCSWTSGYRTLREISLENDRVPKKLTLKDLDKNKDLYVLESYGRLYLMQKESKQKETLTEFEIEQKKKQQIKKELEKKADVALTEMRMFARAAYWSKLVSDLPEDELISRLWKLFRENEAAISLNSMDVMFDDMRSWEIQLEDKREYAEGISDKISDQMLVYLCRDWNKDWNSPVTYDGRYSEDKGKKMMNAYRLLNELYGFSFSDPELLKVMDGSHELYVKEEKE